MRPSRLRDAECDAAPGDCAPSDGRQVDISDSVYPDRYPELVEKDQVVKVRARAGECCGPRVPAGRAASPGKGVLHRQLARGAARTHLQESDIMYFHKEVHKLQPGFYIAKDDARKQVGCAPLLLPA